MKIIVSLSKEAGAPPKGWRKHSGDDELNKWGSKPYNSVFVFNAARKSNGPVYNLTIVFDGEFYQAAHGGVVMPEKYKTAAQAAKAATEWFDENAEK